jgi:hypothetical protein
MAKQVRFVLGGVVLIAAVLILSSQVMSQEKPEAPSPPKAGAQSPAEQGMDDMMAQWRELSAKGPEHKKFEKMVGTWDTESRMWMFPGAQPMVSKGMAVFRLLFDGRYVEQKYKCSMGDEQFEGLGIEGYDNFKKKYVSVWMDNSSTGICMSLGTFDESGKVCTYYGKMDDPLTGQKDKVVKSVAREISDDEVVYEMYDKTPDGKEFKTMEITYTRKK